MRAAGARIREARKAPNKQLARSQHAANTQPTRNQHEANTQERRGETRKIPFRTSAHPPRPQSTRRGAFRAKNRQIRGPVACQTRVNRVSAAGPPRGHRVSRTYDKASRPIPSGRNSNPRATKRGPDQKQNGHQTSDTVIILPDPALVPIK